MDPRDISKEIAAVGQNYYFVEQPPFLRDALEWAANKALAIIRFLRELFRSNPSSTDSQAISLLLQVVIWAMAIATVLVLVYTLVRRVSRIKKQFANKTRGASDIEELQDAAGWRRQAERLALQNEYKGACRALYLSLLQGFHEHGITEFSPARTNYEYSYALAKYPEMQQRFKLIAERVETIWFGNRLAGDEDYAQSLADLQIMDNQIQSIELQRVSDGAYQQ
jgi:hypothetical protein